MRLRFVFSLFALSVAVLSITSRALAEPPLPPCRAISADVVALDQAFYVNRLGALQIGGMIFALRRDVVPNDGSKELKPGAVMLRADKRPRPIVLRMNVGDCLTVHFQNLLAPQADVVDGSGHPITCVQNGVCSVTGPPGTPYDPKSVKMVTDTDPGNNQQAQSGTRYAGVHVMGMQLVKTIKSDGSFVGTNEDSLVKPGDTITYEFYAEAEGAYLLYSTGADAGVFFAYGGQLSQGLFGSVTVQPKGAEWYRSQVTNADFKAASKPGPDGFPVIDYAAKRADGTPILKMLNDKNEIVYTDLTAIITGPKTGSFPSNDPSPVFTPNPAYPNRFQPYREIVIHYHDDFTVAQAFSAFAPTGAQPGRSIFNTVSAGRDFFAINYGIGGIGPEVWANRLHVGPMEACATCKFEEFFLSSWTVGDPAMVVDFPANSVDSSGNIITGRKATKVFFPDDPSNVYHSYIGDNVKYRILHAGTNITHVHHQHAHQWLHSPDSDESHYRDSQMLSPGGAYTLDYVYRGSGNKNQVVGDSIFHCHFYPHFAQGMWGMWRTHDVLEEGTTLDGNGRPATGWNRALPDGEISTGAPTPAIVPMPTYAMAPLPARVQICPSAGPKDFVQFTGSACPAVNTNLIVGYRTLVNEDDFKAGKNPGYPWFISGLAGQRAPQPPLDFSVENGDELNGGLPRHITMKELSPDCSGSTPEACIYQQHTGANCISQSPASDPTDHACMYEKHNQWDFTKENDNLLALELDEKGTPVEQLAMQFHAVRNHPTFKPDGTPATFLLTGKPPVSGAPFANPDVNLDGTSPPPVTNPPFPTPKTVQYRAADIQTDVVLNKKGWHYPQQRMLALWGDVDPILKGTERPTPFFFRVNSGDSIEYWQANLVPKDYELDDFQVRTPTDIIGQHIHLVKFDVTSSDGAANGFNYEDGTLSPDEVRGNITDINKPFPGTNKTGGIFSIDATQQIKLSAKTIPDFGCGPNKKTPPCAPGDPWLGAQSTVQRWYADPLLNNACDAGPPSQCHDRTMQTVFTHDHFGPSTHQQAGLYAGLVIEPAGSQWLNSETGAPLQDPARKDGGPTSWQAIIVPPDSGPGAGPNYREFLLEFEDRQLAYVFNSTPKAKPYEEYADTLIPQATLTLQPCPFTPDLFHVGGWGDPCSSVNKPFFANQNQSVTYGVTPKLITNQVTEGSYSINYSNEPVPYRVSPKAIPPSTSCATTAPDSTDLAHVYQSIERCDPELNVQPAAGTPINLATPSGFKFAPPQLGAGPEDPYTPLLRAYAGEHVQVRNLVGAHQVPHSFHVHGLKWLFEPAFTNSGFRSTQGMGISEHYEFLFQLPKPQSTLAQTDYLYASSSDVAGLTNGNWGILRAYNQSESNLAPVPPKPGPVETTGCNSVNRKFDVTAVFGRNALSGPLIYNARGDANNPGMNQIVDWNALMYVRTDDLDPATGLLKPNAPREPLFLRANAGDCIEVTLRNRLLPNNEPMNAGDTVAMIGRDPTAQNVQINTSHEVGLHPQLVSYDMATDDGVNVGLNPTKTVAQGNNGVFRWYAGTVTSDNGNVTRTPMEFGAVNLAPADPLMQHIYGLVGGLVIEPEGSTWVEDSNSHAAATVTKKDGTKFREFNTVVHDDLAALRLSNSYQLAGVADSNGVHWDVNGTAQPNNFQLTLNEGDTVAVVVQSGFHGFSLLDKNQGLGAFQINQIIPFAAQTGVGANGFGTPGETAANNLVTLLAILQVKPLSEIPAGITSVAFECTIHKTNMAGTFIINRPSLPPSSTFPPPSTIAAPNGWTRAVNYRTEPFSYRFNNPNWLQNTKPPAPFGIFRVLSDDLVLADPQTPVFAAPKGLPVRMRMFHPAGTNEEVITLHGHFWQEEPYTNNATEMGFNPLSQATGSRDAFGANASFDMLLNHAGGKFETPGDYLFRTFIGNDFIFGMWGLMRVGEPNQDIVRITRFQQVNPSSQGQSRIIVSGVNTVNTATGQIAPQVDIFAVNGTAKTKLGSAQVDPMTGVWTNEFNVATVSPQVEAVSPLGGSNLSGPIPRQAPSGAPVIPAVSNIQRLFTAPPKAALENDSNVNSFRTPTHQDKPSGTEIVPPKPPVQEPK